MPGNVNDAQAAQHGQFISIAHGRRHVHWRRERDEQSTTRVAGDVTDRRRQGRQIGFVHQHLHAVAGGELGSPARVVEMAVCADHATELVGRSPELSDRLVDRR